MSQNLSVEDVELLSMIKMKSGFLSSMKNSQISVTSAARSPILTRNVMFGWPVRVLLAWMIRDMVLGSVHFPTTPKKILSPRFQG